MALARILWGASALALLLGAGWFFHRELTSKHEREKALSQRLALVETQVRARPKVAQVRSLPLATVAPEPLDSAAVAAVPNTEGVALPSRVFASDEELWAAYEEDFSEEPFDPAWAREARDAYLPSIQRLLPATSRLVSFECRSKFCRMDVLHESMDTSNGFLMELFARDRNGPLTDSTAGFRATEPKKTANGSVSVIVYIAAKGAQVALVAE